MTRPTPHPSPGPAPAPPVPHVASWAVVRGLVIAFHPGPALAVTVISLVLGIALSMDATRLTLLALCVFTGQLSIGWSNDWLDAGRDRAVARDDKPVATGLVAVAWVRALALVALAATLLLGGALGLEAALVQLVFVASAWAYNVGLKATWLSWLPYAVSFGLLPALVSLAQATPQWPGAGIMIAAAGLGVAAHFANVLPDLADDSRTGVRGLPHRLGVTVGRVVPFMLLAAVAVLLALDTLTTRHIGELPLAVAAALAGAALGVLIAATGIALATRRPATRTLMRLIMLGALLDAVMLAFAGPAMVTG